RIVERKVRCTMCHRNSEKIRMLERPYLRVERIAHHVQPGSRNVGIIPGLLGRRLVRKHFGQCFVIPLLWMVEDHWYGLEIATAGCLCETLHQRVEMRGTAWRQRRLGGRCSRLGRRRKTNCARGYGQSDRSQYAPSSGADHWMPISVVISLVR